MNADYLMLNTRVQPIIEADDSANEEDLDGNSYANPVSKKRTSVVSRKSRFSYKSKEDIDEVLEKE